jgi:hypothetical protein
MASSVQLGFQKDVLRRFADTILSDALCVSRGVAESEADSLFTQLVLGDRSPPRFVQQLLQFWIALDVSQEWFSLCHIRAFPALVDFRIIPLKLTLSIICEKYL